MVFITIRHNEIRDLTANLLSEVCNDVTVDPHLAQVTGERFKNKTANDSDEARLDVSARGFWVRGCKAYMDIRVFNPVAKSYSNQTLKAAHLQNEREKKRQYNERVLQIEHGSFTPLVFSCLGGMSPECQIFYKRLTGMIADKRKCEISVTASLIKAKISFSLVRMSILCIRGSRSLLQNPDDLKIQDIAATVDEARL